MRFPRGHGVLCAYDLPCGPSRQISRGDLPYPPQSQACVQETRWYTAMHCYLLNIYVYVKGPREGAAGWCRPSSMSKPVLQVALVRECKGFGIPRAQLPWNGGTLNLHFLECEMGITPSWCRGVVSWGQCAEHLPLGTSGLGRCGRCFEAQSPPAGSSSQQRAKRVPPEEGRRGVVPLPPL